MIVQKKLSLTKAAGTIIAARRKTMPTHFFTFEIKIDKRVTFSDGFMMLSETYVPIKNKEILWHRISNKKIPIDQEAKDFAQESLASVIKMKAFL